MEEVGKKFIISEQDLKDLVVSLNLNIRALEDGKTEECITSLTTLKNNIKRSIHEMS